MKVSPLKKRRLFFDIEVSPNIGIFWTSGFRQTISYDSILKERAIICICYKWEGEKKIHSLTWDKKQCDKKILKDFVKVAESANEIVGHNGDRFDLTWVRTRAAFHKIPVTPFLKTIDTLKIAKRLFKFNSNRLDYLGQFLEIGCKIQTNYSLWKKVLEKDGKALHKMVVYCKNDVKLLEQVFERIVTYDKPKSHLGVMNGRAKSSCPECGSDHTVIKCKSVSAAGIKKIDMKCNDCGRMHRVSEKTLFDKYETERPDGRTVAEINSGASKTARPGIKRVASQKPTKKTKT